MALADAVVHDWTVMDDLEQVTLTSTRRPGSRRDARLVAMRRQLTLSEKQASSGAYEAGELAWIVPNEQLKWRLKPGDTITDQSGDVYTLLTVKPDLMGALWACTSVNLVIAHDLQDVVDVERAEIQTDASGATIKRFPGEGDGLGSVAYPGLACRVQPVDQAHAEERGLRGQTTRYQVFVGQQLTLTTEDRLKVTWRNGAKLATPLYLEIRRYADAERLGDLPAIEAELVP